MEDFPLTAKLGLDHVLTGRSEQVERGIGVRATNIIASTHLKAIPNLRALRGFPGIELVIGLRRDFCCCQRLSNCQPLILEM